MYCILSEIVRRFSRWNPSFRKVLRFLLFFNVIMGLWNCACTWSPARVSDHVLTSQDYIKVEHVRTWLLSNSLSKFQQFWSECFFSSFLQFTSYCLQGPCSIYAITVLVFHWVFFERSRIMFLFFLLSETCKMFSR